MLLLQKDRILGIRYFKNNVNATANTSITFNKSKKYKNI